MMEKLRIGANSLPVKIIFGLIILGFIFTGVGGFLGFGSGSNDERMYIAKVDGEGIDRQAFENEAQRTLSNYPPEVRAQFQQQIRNQIFNLLLADKLRFELADVLNMQVSDTSLKNTIRQNKMFFVNGSFSNERYLSLLNQNGYTPHDYAQALKDSEVKLRLLDFLIGSDFTLPNELSTFNLLQGQERTFYQGQISVADAVDLDLINISDDEVNDYYSKHKEDFIKSERVKVKYLVNSYASIFANTQKLTDQEIRAEYKNNPLKYTLPEKRKYSIISTNSLEESNNVYKQLKKKVGNDRFQDIGWFSSSDLPDFLAKLKLKKIGDYSSPIAVNEQYIIVKLTGVEKNKKMPFEYAEPLISHFIFQDRIKSKFEKTNALLDEASKDKSLSMEQIAEKTGLSLVEPRAWQELNKFNSIVEKPQVRDIIFSDLMVKDKEATNNISDLINTDDGNTSYVVQVIDYKDEGLADFNEAKPEILDLLKKEKAKAEFIPVVNDILKNFQDEGADNRIKLSERVTVNRNSDKPSSEVVNAVFSLIPPLSDESSYGVDITTDELATVFALIEVASPDNQDDFSDQFLSLRFQIGNNYLIQYLRSKAKIEIMPDANL